MALVFVRATEKIGGCHYLVNPHQCDHGWGPLSLRRHDLSLTVSLFGLWVRCWSCDLKVRTMLPKNTHPRPDPEGFVPVGHFGYKKEFFAPWVPRTTAQEIRMRTVWG